MTRTKESFNLARRRAWKKHLSLSSGAKAIASSRSTSRGTSTHSPRPCTSTSSARSPRRRRTATAARSCSLAPVARSAPGRICTSGWTRTAKPSYSEARSASFVQAFAKIGLIPDCGGTWLLPRLIGPARARALALTAEPLPADKAEAWGLIWKALDDAELMPQAHALCARFTAAPTVALALIKRLLDQSWSNDLDTQ